eukprot:1373748-Pyramimonas_sp.AAC.1
MVKAAVYMYDLDSQYARHPELEAAATRWKRTTTSRNAGELLPLTDAESCIVAHWKAVLSRGAVFSVNSLECGGAENRMPNASYIIDVFHKVPGDE